MTRPVQFFDDQYLKRCTKMSATQICRFLEEFRLIHAQKHSPKKLISIRIPENILNAAKLKAEAIGVPYQIQIQRLIEQWVKSKDLNI